MSQFQLWEPAVQADILGKEGSFGNIEWTYSEFIEHLYEPLRKQHPKYITRRSIGFDSTGKYETWAYEFTPPSYKKTIYLQSGVHVIETDPCFGLARLLTMIANLEDERLAYIRDHVRLLVVPVVSVWGFSNKGAYEELMGPRRHRIKHNSVGINSNRDYRDKATQETINVIGYVAEHASEICFSMDCHSTTERGWGAYLLPYVNGMPEEIAQRHKAINEALYKKHPTSYPQAYMGDEEHYPRGGMHNTFPGGFYEDFGILGITPEHNDYIYDDKLGTSLAMTLAVELIGNHLLCVAES